METRQELLPAAPNATIRTDSISGQKRETRDRRACIALACILIPQSMPKRRKKAKRKPGTCYRRTERVDDSVSTRQALLACCFTHAWPSVKKETEKRKDKRKGKKRKKKSAVAGKM